MTILQSLERLHGRLESNGRAPSYGFSRENISFVIVLSHEGEVMDVEDARDTSGPTPRPQRMIVPQPPKRAGNAAPAFLWDNTQFTFGRTGKTTPRAEAKTPTYHKAFERLHQRLLEQPRSDALRAFARFLERWQATGYEALRHAEAMLDENVVFRLDGHRERIHETEEAKEIWLSHLGKVESSTARCLVTGERGVIARLHPSVKGVAGAQGSGASVVSFDKDAFKSFGKERGANAPVSERAAFAYTAALNTLLERDSRQRIRIGDTTTVFWAESTGDPSVADQAEELFSILADPPTDEERAAEVADKLFLVAQGRPLAEVNPEVDENAPFYVLGLAPNAARLSIRFWHQDSIGAIARRIGEHFRDMRLEPTPWRTALAARRLLYETAVQGKAENIPPTLSGAVMRSILTGGRYPRSMFAAVIARIRADKSITGLRAAICKAALARDHRLGYEEEDVPVSLNRDDTNPAYRLGRLFAIYENVQRAALGKVNATIKDRYFAAASATPASIFPLLERNSTNHLATLRKADKGGLARWFDREIDEVLAGLDTTFPRSLRLEDQGRFAIGYHHQRAARSASADNDNASTESEPHRED